MATRAAHRSKSSLLPRPKDALDQTPLISPSTSLDQSQTRSRTSHDSVSALDVSASSDKSTASEGKSRYRISATEWKFFPEVDSGQIPRRRSTTPSRVSRIKTDLSAREGTPSPVRWSPDVNSSLLTDDEITLIGELLHDEVVVNDHGQHKQDDYAWSISNLPMIQTPDMMEPMPMMPSVQSTAALMMHTKTATNHPLMPASNLFPTRNASLSSFNASVKQLDPYTPQANQSLKYRSSMKLSPVSLVTTVTHSPSVSPRFHMNATIVSTGASILNQRGDQANQHKGRNRVRSINKAIALSNHIVQKINRRQSINADTLVNEEYMKFQREIEEYFQDPTVSVQLGDNSNGSTSSQNGMRSFGSIEIREINSFEVPFDWEKSSTVESDMLRRKRGDEISGSLLKLQPFASSI